MTHKEVNQQIVIIDLRENYIEIKKEFFVFFISY